MKTGIVILNYNDYETTKEMINNIKNYKSLDHIIIVDNNSGDGREVKYELDKPDDSESTFDQFLQEYVEPEKTDVVLPDAE